MGDVQRKFELTGPQIAGSALAGATAAVAASCLGVAGTVIGAALVSVGTTVGTTVYAHYLERTHQKVKQHTENTQRGHTAAKAPAVAVMEAEPAPDERAPWGRIAVAAGVVFAVSMAGILMYQTVADRTVAEQLTGKPARPAARPKPQVGKGTGAGLDVPGRPLRTAATRSASPPPSPSESPAVVSTFTPAPVVSATLATITTPAADPTPAPEPSATAGISGAPSTGAPSPRQTPSPLGTAPEPEPTDPADRRPAPTCRPAGDQSPTC
ncbi:hypothetical protein BKM31_10860 [[Actinomadura] parvosata subsp. kistnae]|uniref:Uncharacterized protein n=1 Tax=[Actinomadura] parvosata subsp. kistnae TaxID=1909395 RepID=A0A1U9ZVC6_9ACTN|nr:hypothetical protein [Nonomuraea sp. ATCC 55076]AQZ61905.1 hypothetical protein BKM31_10860 [Nonomuraea sp. ATCC 55076]